MEFVTIFTFSLQFVAFVAFTAASRFFFICISPTEPARREKIRFFIQILLSHLMDLGYDDFYQLKYECVIPNSDCHVYVVRNMKGVFVSGSHGTWLNRNARNIIIITKLINGDVLNHINGVKLLHVVIAYLVHIRLGTRHVVYLLEMRFSSMIYTAISVYNVR